MYWIKFEACSSLDSTILVQSHQRQLLLYSINDIAIKQPLSLLVVANVRSELVLHSSYTVAIV